MSAKNSIQVAIKVRPLFGKEKDRPYFWRVVDNSIQLLESQTEPYYFDHIFDHNASNQFIFDKMAKQIVHSAIQGFNGTIFAYGQTSSGKTYTMMGDDNNPGVMVLAAKEIFKEIEKTQDRQFLLRVGYIEIYNEKIYDLLEKKNQDLKIHETSTGIVTVNCEEIIIRSEDDLLNHLDKGSKERTVGETNMNERSSRSHAIFRIIIESRKIDRSEDDAVIQSVINLVDLAGSERADQTGARGTRLKEGGHINKSLLFLSNVIKRLSENEDDKYISFRDSKLTRILQASLGGNALTAIICTIKPNAIEETQSTLNFALRAKSIKNKPHVNEIVSDATMMKRLEHEIKVLKHRLEEETRKNESQIKVRQLEQRIKDEDLKIISYNSLHSLRKQENRRRTWCPSSTNLSTSSMGQQASALPLPVMGSHVVPGLLQASRLQAPKSYNTPLITMRPPAESPSAPKLVGGLPIPPDNLPEIDEEFAPAELVNFEMISPIQTPYNKQTLLKTSLTPKLMACPKLTLAKVEQDLLELQSFTNLENKVDVQHNPDLALKQKVDILTQRNIILESERLQYLELKNEMEVTTENLTVTKERCDELQAQLSKLTDSYNSASEKISKYEAEVDELKQTNNKLEMENREAVTLEFEFKRHQNKSKLRENELLEALHDKEKEIIKLEKSLNALSAERLQNSKEELLQKSLNDGEADENGKVCIKCEDLQRLLEENKKITLEFEKLTLEYEKLKLNYIEIEKENESNKLKILDLEGLREKEKDEYEKILLDVQQLTDKLYNVQRDYELLSSQNSSKHDECMALNKEIDKAREEVMVLEEKFTKLEFSWKEQQQTINDIETQYATIQTKYEQLQNQYEHLEATRCHSSTDYQRVEKENIDLQTEIEDLKNKVRDAQQKLLETNAKYEETAKETKTAKEEYSTKTSKVQQENEQLKLQLLDIKTQFDDLQRESDDLSSQLMENLQENEYLRSENTKLKEKLKDFEENTKEVTEAEVKINELKSQLENILSSERPNSIETPSPCRNLSMRSSGVCVEDEDMVNCSQSQDLIRKFCELSESLSEIELEHTKGKTKVFKSASKNSTPKSYKMYLKNILGVQKAQRDFDMEIENIHLQGSFKQHSFHIVELNGEDKSCEIECNDIETNGCENTAAYIEKLKQEILELKTLNEQERLSNKSLLESTERALSEMREHIAQLSNELLEKSTFLENCACKTYQQQIENLEREKADLTIKCEEFQEKVSCTSDGSFEMLINNNAQETEINDKLNMEVEQLKLREQELLQSYDSQTKTLEEMTQRCIDMETDLETAREQLQNQENQFTEKHHQLQLEFLAKLEISANEYRDNMKKYNKEWEERREHYEKTIKSLQNQIDVLKKTATNVEGLKIEIKQKSINDSKQVEIEDEQAEVEHEHEQAEIKHEQAEIDHDQAVEEHKDTVLAEDIESIKEDKFRLEDEKLRLQQELNKAEELLMHMKEENRTQYEEISLLESKLVSLEELLTDAKLLHLTLSRENSCLKTELDNIKEDLNCIPEMHEKNQQLSNEIEKIMLDKSNMQEKLLKAESQIQKVSKENTSHEELIKTLQTELAQLTLLEKEKNSLANDFKNLKQEHAQVQSKLQQAEQQIQEFCCEDASREELIQTLQTQLCSMTAVEEENKNILIESVNLKQTLNRLQEKETESCKEIENLKLEIETLKIKGSELINSGAESQLEKTDLKEKLRKITSECNLLETRKDFLNNQLTELSEEKTTSFEVQLKCLKEKEKTEGLLEQTIKEKAEHIQNLSIIKEQLEIAQNQLEEKEKQISHAREEKVQIQRDLEALKESLIKTIEEKQKQLEETNREKEKTKRDNFSLYHDLQALKKILGQTTEENQEQQRAMEECQIVLTKLEREKKEQEFALEKANQENKTLKESLSNVTEENQKEFNNLENNFKQTQQENQKLQHQLNIFTADLIKFKEGQQEKSRENSQLKAELQATMESLSKLQEEQLNLQQKLRQYEKLQEDKNTIESTLNVLKKTQTGAISKLQEEKDKIYRTLQQYQIQNKEFKEKEETLKHKNESLSQQLHEMRGKAHSYEKLLLEHEELENVLKTKTAENQKLQEEIAELTSQQENYVSKIGNLTSEMEKLNLQLDKHTADKQMLETKLSHLQETIQGEHSSLRKEHHELKGSFEELKLKFNSLQATNDRLENLNQQLEQQLTSAEKNLKQLKSLQEELKVLIVQHIGLKNSLKKTAEEVYYCSLALSEEVDLQKQLLKKHWESNNLIKGEMETKQHSLSEENLKLSANIKTLQKEKLSLEDKLREITVRNFEQDLQRLAFDAAANSSTDSNISCSSKGRRSLERMSLDNIEGKLMQQKNSTTVERKNRRLSTHDERRRQSYWGAAHDKETMTDPVDTSCNCMELDRKLKECERNLFIKNSQVTALNMELKNHPLKDENSTLKKRLQEEQDKYRIEMKRYKSKLYEQTAKAEKALAAAAHATAKSTHAAAQAALVSEQQRVSAILPKIFADADTQTDNDLSVSLQKLQSKYNDLKNICRKRYNVIKDLEEKVSQKENSDGNILSAREAAQFKILNDQCESLKRELKVVNEKYENAKRVLHLRREEIGKLRAQSGETQ